MGRDGRTAFLSAGLLLGFGLLTAVPAHAYDGALHQQFTFLAARYFNRCLDDAEIRRLAPLEVRYAARAAAAEAAGGWLGWAFRSDYYDRARQSERTLLWVADTRLHGRFRKAVAELEAGAPPPGRYATFGRAAAHLQNMTSPAHVVPVNFSRWWRLSLSDRFDSFPVDGDGLEADLLDACAELLDPPESSLEELLLETANDTLRAVQRPIEGLPASWQAFWQLAPNPEDFGEYGPAGNSFGNRVEFTCQRQRCVLLDDDPLYRAFAFERHRLAVVNTARAMLWLQRRHPGEED
jgi:hypothetical protein